MQNKILKKMNWGETKILKTLKSGLKNMNKKGFSITGNHIIDIVLLVVFIILCILIIGKIFNVKLFNLGFLP